MDQIELPFKPFTFAEVKAVTGVGANVLDAWVADSTLPPKRGDDGLTVGLNIDQLFACFVAQRYIEEGADLTRATRVLQQVVSLGMAGVIKANRTGRNFVVQVEGPCGPTTALIEPPLRLRLGRLLNLRVLFGDFDHRIKSVFYSVEGS